MRVTTIVHYVLPFLALVGGAMILVRAAAAELCRRNLPHAGRGHGHQQPFPLRPMTRGPTCCCGAGCRRPGPARARIPEGGARGKEIPAIIATPTRRS